MRLDGILRVAAGLASALARRTQDDVAASPCIA